MYQILSKLLVPLWRYCDFSNFNMAAAAMPPSRISEIAKFYWLLVSRGSRRISMPNFVKIKIFRFFQDGGCRHLGFSKSWIVICWRYLEDPDESLYQISSKSFRCGDIAISRIFKMAAVRHLRFVWGTFGRPAVSTWRSLSLCKIWLWSMQ